MARNNGLAEAPGNQLGSTTADSVDDPIHLSQSDLARRWNLSPQTLERWRSEGSGPKFLKLHGGVRYRLEDIVAYEQACLRSSTSASA